ncbi:hypothetical protein BVG16_05590 [Paenibacillus selenitireducens]|uniref:Phage head-tail adapter protein n=1 Tax=Paenibacillus selenitireducens TaxID=1324314 RepID=A0A1T2XKF9_9BACL|nr:hypothetical protein [Paenibacillus selenitireducens]OPA80216.1 hypothetical protein BVG16_05590 [Paenibacillus selenitireducens]
MLHFMQQSCTIRRLKVTWDEYNSPTSEEWITLGKVRSRWRRKQFQALGPDANGAKHQVRERYRLYLPLWADIQAGDLVYAQHDPEPFEVSASCRIGTSHKEVEVERVRSL